MADLTKKHFKAVADILNEVKEPPNTDGKMDDETKAYIVGYELAHMEITGRLMKYFLSENPNFQDREFVHTVYPGGEK